MNTHKDPYSGTWPIYYDIHIQERLDAKWADWFNGMSIAFERMDDGPPITTLTGAVTDQAELRGMLSKIWDLNLTLISVIRLELCKGDRSHP